MRSTSFQLFFNGLAVAAVVAALFFAGCSKNPGTENPREAVTNTEKPGLATNLSLERVMVAVTNTMTTLMQFNRTSPPPWPRGNYLTFHFRNSPAPGAMEEWVLWPAVNFHAENFSEITRRLRIDSVEVRVLHSTREIIKIRDSGREERSAVGVKGFALVTDPRIPRDWFLSWRDSRWDSVDRETRDKCQAAFPGSFRATD